MTQRKVLRLSGDTLSVHADLSDFTSFLCNDMVVDREGNAYVGNFGFDLFNEGLEAAAPATLALLRPDGEVRECADDLMFPNGAVISDDGSTLIVGETFGSRFTAFDITDNGALSNRRIWATVDGHYPDGCTLDADGGIWFADPGGGGLIRVKEGGTVTDQISTDQPVFACALGGPDGNTLFACSAPGSGPDEAAGKAAGAILMTTVTYPHVGQP